MIKKSGFTLIELSIVLVIIGLVTGSILVGLDLITAASVRAELSQIEKFQAATNTFRGKYGYLPGDIPDPTAQQYGFPVRGTNIGEGDGNGTLIGGQADGPCSDQMQAGGETGLFWVDLSTAGLIEGKFTSATNQPIAAGTYTSPVILAQYFPQARLGSGNYVYVYSGGYSGIVWPCDAADSLNYFGVSAIAQIAAGGYLSPSLQNPGGLSGLTVSQAYNIDRKIDDGYPQTGRVLALLLAHEATWASGDIYGNYGACGWTMQGCMPTTAATSYATTNCYDNSGVAGPQQYSMKNASLLNCAVSIRFQ